MALTSSSVLQDSTSVSQESLLQVNYLPTSYSNNSKDNAHNYLYDNFIYQYNSLNTLNDECYIIDKQVVKPVVEVKTVFKSSTEIQNSKGWIHPKELKQNPTNDLFIIPFLIGLVAFVTILVRYSKYLGKFFEGLIYAYVVEKFVADLNVPTRRLLLLLDTIAIITLSFLTFSFIGGLGAQSTTGWANIILFLLILGALFAYRLYYYILHKSIELIIPDKTFTQKLYFDTLIAIRGGGFVLFPLSLIVFYINAPMSGYLLYGSIGLLAIILIYRFIRLLSLFLKNSVSFLYFILYLCALEIVPVIILYLQVQRM
ncbi:MAG: DUF4271 domain-containing protein [Bacteroidales bacterium]|nr:MAG: DUF4271 domain-containing protein [Bacteroidales bacterium]